MIVNIVILILMLSIAITFFVVGYQLKRSRWLMLMAGYNDLPIEKREKIDGKALGKDTGKTMTIGGVFIVFETIVTFISLSNVIQNKLLSVGLIIVPIILFIVYVVRKSLKGAKYYNSL